MITRREGHDWLICNSLGVAVAQYQTEAEAERAAADLGAEYHVACAGGSWDDE
jgi:hypothetical protein